MWLKLRCRTPDQRSQYRVRNKTRQGVLLEEKNQRRGSYSVARRAAELILFLKCQHVLKYFIPLTPQQTDCDFYLLNIMLSFKKKNPFIVAFNVVERP